ncbi:hypothetical protein CK203_057831 [Vitis vinifera]|uniref:CCHC-type domain-containing protein n=1 Tax=Vitis vinifera TaxID=29760 RepID=A0A438GFQ1_VITVI|nr:hypothetical protein CK203_057831 [Vitis vinifera]
MPNASNKVQNPTIKQRGNCFVCGKFGHHAAQCCHRKRTEKSNSKANLIEVEVITIVISSEEGNEQVFLGDSRSTPVIGKEKVLLKLTSGKVLALSDVLHVLDIN